MKILVVMQFHPFPGGGGAARFAEMTRHWAAAGHEVTILTSNIDHQTGKVPTGHEANASTSSEGGINIVRVSAWSLDKRSAKGRILRDMSFAFHAARIGRRLPRSDVVVASSPPLFTGLAGVRIARRHGVPLVF